LKKYWSELAKGLTPYVPGEQPKLNNLIKLNTNENPYAPSPKVREAIDKVCSERLRLYPDPECSRLKAAIARRHGVGADRVFVGNGSDEVLAFCFPAFFGPARRILFPDITYSFYKVYAAFFGIPYETVPLREDFSLDAEDLSRPCGGVLLANPNAPTGLAMQRRGIEQIARHCESLLLVDEAYVEFGGESAVDLTAELDNLLVVKTFSKSHSLAGMRVGYAIGHQGLIEALECVKNSFNSYTLDVLAQAAAIAAIEDDAYCAEQLRKIRQTREWTAGQLQDMGFCVLPSSANFLFIRHPEKTGAQLMQQLRGKGIIVRHFEQERIRDFMRVTIGTQPQMQQFVRELGALV
jgi:histidinol-phosphate aminotransferase